MSYGRHDDVPGSCCSPMVGGQPAGYPFLPTIVLNTVCCVSATPVEEYGMPVTQNLRKGMRAARAGRKDEAIIAFRAVLEQDANNETALIWLGYLSDDPQVSLNYITHHFDIFLRNRNVADFAPRLYCRQGLTLKQLLP